MERLGVVHDHEKGSGNHGFHGLGYHWANASSFYPLPGIWPWLSSPTERLDLDTPVSHTD